MTDADLQALADELSPCMCPDKLYKPAELFAILKGVRDAEREQCARVAITRADHHRGNCPRECRCADGWHIADAIRRGV